MKKSAVHRYCGRDFSADEMRWIARIAARREAGWTRKAISRAVCEHLDWRKPDGGLKDMSARVALLRMHRHGLIELPPPASNAGLAKIRCRPSTDLPQTDWPTSRLELPAALPEVQPLQFEMIQAGPRSPLWEFVHRALSLSRLQSAARCADSIPRQQRLRATAGAARIRCGRLEDRAARPLHRLVARMSAAQPASGGEQCSLSDTAVDPYSKSGFAYSGMLPTTSARGLAAALRHPPGTA